MTRTLIPSLLVVVVLVLTIGPCLLGCKASAGLFYVTPSHESTTQSDVCSPIAGADPEPCFTMEEMWGNQTQGKSGRSLVFESDSTLVFLRGLHVVTFSRLIIFRDVDNITLTGEPGSDGSPPLTEIYCANHTGFYFLNISQLTISHLIFTNCGKDGVTDDIVHATFNIYANSFLLFDALEMMTLTIAVVTDLTVIDVTVQNGTGYGLLAVNLFGNSIIKDSKFLFNNFYTYSSTLCNSGTFESADNYYICTGGNMALAFVDPPECISEDNPPIYSLNITSTQTAYGTNLVSSTIGAGIVLAMSQTAYGIHVYMDNVTSINNAAHNGANMAFLIYKIVDESSISIRDSFSGFSNPFFRPSVLTILTGTQFVGGGLFFNYGRSPPSKFRPSCKPKSKHNYANVLTIMDTEFVGNNAILGGAMNIDFNQVDVDIVAQINIKHCSFRDNIGSPGSALYINQLQTIHYSLLARFLFKNCTFKNNTYPVAEIPNSIQQFELDLLNTVQLISVQDVSFVDCLFEDNLGSAVYSYASLLRFSGDVTFVRNVGINGGGVSLHGSSVMILTPNTTMLFHNNSAQFRGGGLYISSENYRAALLCFWQIETTDFQNETGVPIDIVLPIDRPTILVNVAEELNIHVSFIGNVAYGAGSAIFGGMIDRCTLLSTVNLIGYRQSGRMFDQMFTFPDSENDTSVISSDPFRICICNHTTPTCDATNPHVTLFPGQTYDIYAVAIGQRNGTSPGVVFGEFIRGPKMMDDVPSVLQFESTQQVEQSCTKLSYTILSTQLDVELQLLLALENSNVQSEPTVVTIQLLPCPPGFFLSSDPPSCQCHPFLADRGVECDITTETIHRVPPKWLSKDLEHSDLSSLLLYDYCPFDYCVPYELALNLSQPDTLCAFNRTGIICGGCQPGYSLTLGTNKCEMCTNSYLALLIPFAVAGLVLVLLLLLFNSLTVSVGAINGLIFYANIVQVNKDIFFPPGHSNLMTTFIAWLNLDLGIETCFYDGMDAYAKTLLQFVFPVYIWTLIGVVILLGHYLSSVAKVLGEKGVPVLATVFLLSVAKLQRTIIIGLSYVTILHTDGRSTLVWSFDGNIEYLKGKHIYLFILSLAMLLFVMLPFVFSLLFVTCLQALSAHRLFHWVNRIKPLIDAYLGPYKDKHRYWTGFLLFARGAILITISQVDQPSIILLMITVSMQLLSVFTWVGGGVYKKWPINVLEFSFFVNLGVLSAATLYVRDSGGYQEGAIYTSITIAFLEFLGIVVFAIFQQLDSCFKWNIKFDSIKDKLSKSIISSPKRRTGTSNSDRSDSVMSLTKTPMESTNFELVVNRGDANSLEGSVTVELREPLLESGHHTI